VPGLLAASLVVPALAALEQPPPIPTAPAGSGSFGQPQVAPQPAQPGQPARDAQQPRTGTARIKGRVVTADTGAPLRRVQLRLTGREFREGQVAQTDADGRYEFRLLPAGRYSLSASKAGYVALSYGQRRPFEPGRPLEIADGQLLENVDFVLPRGAVIAGRITDEFGEPVADAIVQAMRFQFLGGERRLVPTGRGAQTDDIGQFRLHGLQPGEYFVSARVMGSQMMVPPGAASLGASDTAVGFAPTYFPGTPSVTEAQRIAVGVGDVGQADFQLVPVPVARISGTVLDSSGKPAPQVMVRLSRNEEVTVGGFGVGGVAMQQDGSFTIGGVAPGTYEIVAITMGPGGGPGGPGGRPETEPEFGSASVTVAGEDIMGVTIVMTRGATISGQVVVEPGSSPLSLASVMVTATPRDLERSLRPQPPARVKDDGTFELKGVAGRLFLQAQPRNVASSGWFVREVAWRGEDVLDQGLDARAGQNLSGVRIVLSNRSATLNGVVTDERGNMVKESTVLLFAEDASRWTSVVARQVRMTRPDQNGRYSIESIVPGQYLVVALEYLDGSSIGDPELLERYRARARPVQLGDGERKTQDLRLVVER
jgi:protocatechuate 3,4-dioxygenase beta subunit